MATLRKRWPLSIFLVFLPHYCAVTVPPAPPANLQCIILCQKNDCEKNITCTWDHTPDPKIPTNYSLHWMLEKREAHVINVNRSYAFIHREKYRRYSDISVWVQANNQNGSSKSEIKEFNTEFIRKWEPPQIQVDIEEQYIDITWNSICDVLSENKCDIRHRTGGEIWKEAPDKSISYLLKTQPCIFYELQVRCSCGPSLKSDWCESRRVRLEKAPVVQLDLWRDCGMSSMSTDCVLMWKKFPSSQACGHILRYEVELFDKNGTVSVNLSTAEPSSQLVCDEMQCYFNSSLKDVFSANVTAHNAQGASRPSNLNLQIRGKEQDERPLHLKMNKDNLTVSWNMPDQLSEEEYVVQYKQAGSPPGQGFDWVRVKKGQTTQFLKGQFKNYTPYQVSLFSVQHSGELRRISSAIGYSRQGTPSKVPLFKVDSISATSVTLFWEPVPLFKQYGVILHYQIGEGQNIRQQVRVPPQQKNQTCELKELTPGQEYEVWIKAVTEAGPGVNVTIRFKTKLKENYALIILFVLVPCILVIICLPLCLSIYRGESKACPLMPSCLYEKVPDPHNSRIFRQMKHQMNDSLAWICISIYEPHPNISLLEIVEIQPKALESSLETTSHPNGLSRPLVGGGSSQIDCEDDQREDFVIQECDRTGCGYEREEYSKMVDSDEERDKGEEDGDDYLSSSEDEQYRSGYEKHFMPTALEVLEV